MTKHICRKLIYRYGVFLYLMFWKYGTYCNCLEKELVINFKSGAHSELEKNMKNLGYFCQIGLREIT